MIHVGFLLPHFRPGGAERVVLNWIGALDRTRFAPLLFLKTVDGAFLDLLPPDVQPIALGAGRALRLPRHIGAALAAHDVDVAYSATNAMNLALLAARTGARRIVSEHTPPAAYLAEAKLPLLRRAAMRRLYPYADAVAVPTDRIDAELAVVLGRQVRTATLPNPVVAERCSSHLANGAFSGAQAAGDPVPARLPPRPVNAVPQLVSAGRLVAAKGFDTLIDAAALLAARGLPFRLTIRGEGTLKHALQQRIDAAGLAGHVTLAGHTDSLGPSIAAADLFVLASRREGFGNVIVEAMAAGTPVLATRSGGPETLIRDGDNGFLVPPDDPATLAEAIAALIADPARREHVRGPAADTARGFGIAASTRRFEALVAALARPRSMAA